MDAGLVNPTFWWGMVLALAVAYVAAYPVNRYLLTKGKGHALTMQYHHGSRGDAGKPDRGRRVSVAGYPGPVDQSPGHGHRGVHDRRTRRSRSPTNSRTTTLCQPRHTPQR